MMNEIDNRTTGWMLGCAMLLALVVAFFCLLPLRAAPVLGAPLGAVQRIYSNTVSNRAWRLDTVQVRDGKLHDATGTLAAAADIEYLRAVNEGIVRVLAAGSNAFKRAEAEFRAALTNNPPGPSTFISMVIPPYSDKSPDNRNPYGLLVREGSDTVDWYLSQPFRMKPNVVCQDVYVDAGGTVRTQYQAAAWTDYFPDATNVPAPHVVGDWGRVVRMTDPEPPPDAKAGTSGGYPVIIRDSHLHFGHPEHGLDWGGMLVDVVDGDGVVHHTVTGVYTNTIGGVRYEVEIYRGAFKKFEPIQ